MKNISVSVLLKSILLTVYVVIHAHAPALAQNWANLGNPNFSAGGASSVSLAMDPVGNPYIAYIDAANQNGLTVMTYGGNGWVPLGYPGLSNGPVLSAAIAVDGTGTPYVAYADGSLNGALTVMSYSNGAWSVVGNAGFTGGSVSYPSLAIDGADVPYVAYQDISNNGGATVMKFDGQGWVTVGKPGFSAGSVQSTTIAIDNGGMPYIAYQDMSGNMQGAATVMAYTDSAGWAVVGAPGFSGGQANTPSIAIDGMGTPYVAYQDCANNCMATVMSYINGAWTPVGNPGFSAGVVQYTSIALNAGYVYVIYLDASMNNAATVMRYDDGGWVTEGSAGFTPTLSDGPALTVHGGIPAVGFADATMAHLTTVVIWGGPISPWDGETCGVMYFYDAIGNRIYRTDSCISNAPTYKTSPNSDTMKTIKAIGSSNITANLYPNPTDGIVNIAISEPIADAAVTVLDIKGSVIQKTSMTGSSASLDVSNYAPGSYMVIIKNAAVKFTFKLQKL